MRSHLPDDVAVSGAVDASGGTAAAAAAAARPRLRARAPIAVVEIWRRHHAHVNQARLDEVLDRRLGQQLHKTVRTYLRN